MFLLFFSFKTLSAIDYFHIKKIGEYDIKVGVEDLEKLKSRTIQTDTIYTANEEFTGVLFKDLFDRYNVKGLKIRALAWDDYSYSMSIDELERCNVILAFKMNGEYLKIEELGPFAIIYPKSVCPELNKLDINAKTVMQVKYLEVIGGE